jgi:hypothetical protein
MIRRMKIISKLTLWLGILIAIAGIVSLLWAGWVAYQRFLALDALRSADVTSLWAQMVVAGIALPVGGFLLGLGVGITPKTPKVDATAKSSAS